MVNIQFGINVCDLGFLALQFKMPLLVRDPLIHEIVNVRQSVMVVQLHLGAHTRLAIAQKNAAHCDRLNIPKDAGTGCGQKEGEEQKQNRE